MKRTGILGALLGAATALTVAVVFSASAPARQNPIPAPGGPEQGLPPSPVPPGTYIVPGPTPASTGPAEATVDDLIAQLADLKAREADLTKRLRDKLKKQRDGLQKLRKLGVTVEGADAPVVPVVPPGAS